MFSRIGVNENCAEFASNHFVPIIPSSCTVLVKRHATYNLCPTPIKKIQKTSIEEASSLSVLKSKVNNTSYVNSQLSNRIDIIPEAFERLYTKHNEIRSITWSSMYVYSQKHLRQFIICAEKICFG